MNQRHQGLRRKCDIITVLGFCDNDECFGKRVCIRVLVAEHIVVHSAYILYTVFVSVTVMNVFKVKSVTLLLSTADGVMLIEFDSLETQSVASISTGFLRRMRSIVKLTNQVFQSLTRLNVFVTLF